MENKTSKYFKYAIGEIILVVIGILIALQINNWNQNRINDKQEQQILLQLKSEFEENLEELDRKDNMREKMINSAEQLFKIKAERQHSIIMQLFKKNAERQCSIIMQLLQ